MAGVFGTAPTKTLYKLPVIAMKQRFGYLDLRLVTHEAEPGLINCRLQNIYSLEQSSRHFMLKFDSHGEGKQYAIVDPGLRFHLTRYQHQPTDQPTGFVTKLRKHLRTRRVSGLWVAPQSRLLVISFSEGQYHLILEFFAGGNIILTDEVGKILSLFRVVQQTNCMVGQIYPIEFTSASMQAVPPIDELRDIKGPIGKALYTKFYDPSASLIEFYLRDEGIDPKAKECDLEAAHRALTRALDHAHRLMNQAATPGFILRAADDQSIEFEPFREYFDLMKKEDQKITEYPTYNQTVDEYFGAILSDRHINRVEQLHQVASSRLEAAQREREKRLKGLEDIQSQNDRCGYAIQASVNVVDQALQAVREMLQTGSDWGDIWELVKVEQQKGNTIAEHIRSLDLGNEQITLGLPDADTFEDEVLVKIHLSESAWANARRYFDVRKQATDKMDKTEKHAAKAYKSAEAKIKRDLQANLAKHKAQNTKLQSIREPYWFEKFYWSLTSDSTLLIGGRDDMQNEILLRRYFGPSDLLVGSDAPGASLVLIKTNRDPIPQTLLQASSFCAATSQKAWESRMSTPAWYLPRAKVPRKNSMGDPVTVNDLLSLNRVRLPPVPLDMGVAILWQISKPQQEAEIAEEFPDTEMNSDEDFPDTAFDSDAELLDDDYGGDSEENENPQIQDLHVSNSSEDESGSEDEQNNTAQGSRVTDEPQEEQGEPIEEEEEEEEETRSNSESQDMEEHGIESPEMSKESSPGPANAGLQNSLPLKLKGKSKTAQKKLRRYMEQDEDDRQHAMERLGTLKGLEQQAQEKKEREDARRRQQDAQRARKQRAREAELRRIESEEVEETPLPNDLVFELPKDIEESQITGAVAMFGPWASMQRSKFKVKLMPGQIKKGKASSEILRVIMNSKDANPTKRQLDLIQGIRAVDLQGFIAVSRVQLGGPLAQKKGAQSSKKGASNRGRKNK